MWLLKILFLLLLYLFLKMGLSNLLSPTTYYGNLNSSFFFLLKCYLAMLMVLSLDRQLLSLSTMVQVLLKHQILCLVSGSKLTNLSQLGFLALYESALRAVYGMHSTHEVWTALAKKFNRVSTTRKFEM